MALEGISHDITPDRHIVTLYPNPARIYTYFIVGGYTTTTTRTNLVPNPSFETNTTGWGATNATATRDTSQSYSGSASYKLVAIAAAQMYSGTSPFVPVSAGTQYTFSYYAKTESGTRNANAPINWYTSGGVFISQTSGATTSLNTSWQRVTQTVTAPVNAARAIAYINIPSAFVGLTIYADAILFEQASSALPYFDGTYADTYTGYTLTSQGWSGTANGSTSTATWGLTSSFVGSELDDETKGLA
jgi:hypothetical protein